MNEKGSALLLAVILSFLLMALGLALTMSSLSEFSMSDEFESHEKALFIAEAGLGASESLLRGRSLDESIRQESPLRSYLGFQPETPRDPIAIEEARDIDFNRVAVPEASLRLTGILTPPQGQPMGRGRYFARVSDNDDGDADPLFDADGKVHLRVVGVHPGPPQEVTVYGSNLKNSVVMLERVLKRDMSLDVSSPFNVYGPSAVPLVDDFFNGNSFLLDGYDHSEMSVAEILEGGHNHSSEDTDHAAVGVINNDADGGDATNSLQDIYNSLDKNQLDNNLIGASGPNGSSASIRDETDLIRNSENEDATNIFNPAFLANFVNRVSAIADNRYADGTELSGNNILLGTEDNPEITVAMGDISLSGSGSGAGILIVKGTLEYSGAFDYNGLILVMGEGEVIMGGANKSVLGGMYLAKLLQDENGQYTFGEPGFSISGRSNFYFRSKSVRMAISLLPFKALSWREITREISSPHRLAYSEVQTSTE